MDNLNGTNDNQFGANNNMPNMNGMQNNMQNGMPNANGMYNGMYNGGNAYQQGRSPVKRTSKGVIALIIGLFIFFIGVIVVGSIVVAYFVATNEKEKITINEFMEECSEKALELEDVTSSEIEVGLSKAYKATNIGKNYTITFYEFDTNQNAASTFSTKKNAMEIEKNNNGIGTSANMKNYAFYSVKANGKFMYAAYVDNTLLYAEGNSADEIEIKDIIDEFDY